MKIKSKNETPQDFLMSQLEICETKEDLIMAFWFYWVDNVVTKSDEFQMVLASALVNRWFITELRKGELEFRNLMLKFPDTDGKERDWQYCKCISKLMSRFPKALIESAKSRKLREKPIKIQGIKIFIPIKHQN